MKKSELLNSMTLAFSDSELQDICFELDVDYEQLPTVGKGGKIRELIQYLDRRGRLPELIEICQRLRPKISWTSERDLKGIRWPDSDNVEAEQWPNRPEDRLDQPKVDSGIATASSQHQESATKDENSEVFVSYAWGGGSEKMVDQLEQAFARRGIRIVRDKKDLGYKGSIDAFERRIGQGHCIVLVISDKYLRSEHCMYELVEADENSNLRDRIFPIVLPDAKIYKAIDRLTYIKHWDEQIEKLNQAIKDVKYVTNLAGIIADLEKYARIRDSFDHLTDLLSDMNALTPKMHATNSFSTLIDAVESHIDKRKRNDLRLEQMVEIFERDFVTVQECDTVSRSLEFLVERLSFPPRYRYRKGPYITRIREIVTRVGAFRGICDKSTPKMETDKEEILDLLTDLRQDLEKHGAILR